MLTHEIPTLWGRYYHPYFSDEKIEAQSRKAICSTQHSQQVAGIWPQALWLQHPHFWNHTLMWWGSISQLSPLSGNNHFTFLEYDEHYFLPLIQEMSFAFPCIVNWLQRLVSEVQSESVEQTLSDPNNSCPHSLRGQRGEWLGMIWAEVSRLTELGVVANGALMSRCRW